MNAACFRLLFVPHTHAISHFFRACQAPRTLPEVGMTDNRARLLVGVVTALRTLAMHIDGSSRMCQKRVACMVRFR